MAIKKIGELLVESALITQEQLDEALKIGSETRGTRLGTILVKKGYASEIDIAQTLAFQLNIPFIDITSAPVDPEALKLVNERIAQKHSLIPVYLEKKVLKIAMSDPLNLAAIDDVRFSAGCEILPCVATLSDVNAAISRFYNLAEPIDEIVGDLKKDKNVEILSDPDINRDLSEHVKKSNAPPIIKMVDSIIIHGAENRASDVHIEPHERGVKLRIRVDGIMRETMQLPKWVQGPVISRIKLMSKMDIAERRVSQDGRIRVRLADKALDIRVSTLPTQYGETVVMRLLDSKSSMIELADMGLSKIDYENVLDMIERPQGVVLVTGPTGSGKTSLLYSMLRHVKSEEINIITIEDPVEYELQGVNQVSINDKTGLTFAYTLRSVLRQDPDVIMVGEMRDTETATIALQASVTGHLVFSTLHTNDAVSTIIRLKNMGIPQYMIGTALNGVIAIRLVRKICESCKQEYTPNPSDYKKTGISPDVKKLYRGAGCKSCNNSGYSGRTGIFEVLITTPKIKNLIASDVNEQELLKAAVESGMTTLQKDGLLKVYSGITTIEELTRVIHLSKSDAHDDEHAGVCPNCFKHVLPGSEACPHCGHLLAKTCSVCNRPRNPEWVVCPYCAAKFDK